MHWDRNIDITIFSLQYMISWAQQYYCLFHMSKNYFNMAIADDLLDGNEVVDYQEDSLTIKVD